MTIRFGPEDITKLKQLITEGTHVMTEVETLNEGLRDTVKHIAEEMGIKPGVLTKAIKVAHKAEFHKHRDDFDTLETILEVVGRADS
jgi:hypothetical protein|tara:strand:- start:6 stop:266 length:261 start_codon:yes stop_codon:yes gene_type:complete